MSDSTTVFKTLARVGGVIGKGLIAGFAGTAAITVSQMIEMQLTNRGMSSTPAKVGGKALGVEPRGKAELEQEKARSGDHEVSQELQERVETNKQVFSQLMHFGYGTGWGLVRGGLDMANVKGLPASAIHFGAIWGAAKVMLPAADAAEPITKWSPKQIAIDVLHHAVYAAAAGAVYDAMNKAEETKSKKKKKKKDKKKGKKKKKDKS